MSENIIFLSNVRISFPNIAAPQQKKTGEPTYNAEFLLTQDHPGFQKFMVRVGQVAVEKWGENAGNVLTVINQDRRFRCYGRGEEKVNQKTFKPYDGYPGMCYITAGNKRQPQIIKPDGSAVDPANTMEAQQIARKIYGGCMVNVAVKPWPQNNEHGRAVRCELVAIQFSGDNTPFGEGTPDVSGMFGGTVPAMGEPSPAGMPAWGAPAPAPAAPAPQMPQAPFGAPGLPSFLA